MANTAAAAATPPGGAKPRAKEKAKTGGIPLFAWLTDNAPFKTFILLVIIANSIMLGYDAHFGPTNPYHHLIEVWDNYFLYIFTAELALEFLAQGPNRYFRDGWNWFDCVIVGLSYLSSIPGITALRTFRVLRVFRLVSNVPQMRRVVEALVGALPGIAATMMVLTVVFYIGAVMATTLFRAEDGFHDLGQSALTLFQLTQFDGWGDTVTRMDAKYPYAWVFLMGFTVIAAFAVLNLFIGVIVEAVQAAPQHEIKEEIEEVQEDVAVVQEAQEDAAVVQKHILDEVRALRAELAALRNAPPPA